MRFAAPIAGCVHGKWKLEYHVVWHLTSLRQATELREMIWKIFFTFYFHILPEQRHIGARIIPCRCIKKTPSLTHLAVYWQWIETASKIVGLWENNLKWCSYWYILLQTKTRIMTMTQHDSVLHAFSVPYWSEICGVVDALTVPRLSPTGKFRSIYAVWCKELDISLYIHTHTHIYIYIYIWATPNHPLDNRYGFSLSIGNTKNDHVATSTCLEWQL